MLQQQEYILTTENEYKQINSVKDSIQEIHNSGNFFQLSLKTLELIRRFNKLYVDVFEHSESTPSNINQLMITGRALETQLVRES